MKNIKGRFFTNEYQVPFVVDASVDWDDYQLYNLIEHADLETMLDDIVPDYIPTVAMMPRVVFVGSEVTVRNGVITPNRDYNLFRIMENYQII